MAKVGGLDEGYGLGMFEDDDLTMAVRDTGHKVLLRDAFMSITSAARRLLPPRKYLAAVFTTAATSSGSGTPNGKSASRPA